ncbi:glycosyltransferase family 4 protein [Flavobacterium sp. GN10]|uniref:Glycosyltransferase family 4 protein n=1 Tax=Flavobacterium tagetis TaxID=2801336 RepID=A0ABS1KIL6_9FLAO|nr:glycosyltransferase family 4 protein [Flavobacterium tagetis]MBL0739315.1 glycosyltransferase family 4 protein [Flavobacterium tagetis]
MGVKDLSIGLIEPVGGHGGMDYYDYGLALGLGANDVKVLFYTCNETNERKYENVLTLFYFKRMWNRHFIIKAFKYLYGHYSAISDLKRRNVKIIHMHFFTFRSIDLIILYYARLNNLKKIVTIHDINSFDKRANNLIEKICFKYIDGIIVHNESSLKSLNSKFNLSIPKAIIPHGNYLPFIDRLNDKAFKHSNKFSLLFFGQIKKVKGLDILLKAISILKKNNCQVELTIAGKAWKDDLEKYKQMITNLELEDIVVSDFRYIPDNEVGTFYEKADLIILPYRDIYQSGVLLLALSYGKPVLCSDLDPFKEIIIHNENGFLFKSENPQDLAQKIQEIVSDKTNLTRVKNNTKLLIRDKYSWIKIGGLTKKFYHSILSSEF